MVFRIWRGTFLTFFLQVYCIFDVMYYIIPLRVFISWLTAHSLINYFTLNARVSGVRILRLSHKDHPEHVICIKREE